MAKIFLIHDSTKDTYVLSENPPPTLPHLTGVEVDINASRLKYIRQILKKYQGTQDFLKAVLEDVEKHPNLKRRYG